MKIFCIIPAFNEEKNIVEVLRRVKNQVDEIVVVDDGSSDNTYAVSKGEGVRVLRHFINRGQGAALETGNQYALKHQADIVIHFDADGQFLAEEIKDMIGPVIAGEAEVVLGSRFMGKPNNMPAFKKHCIMPAARLVNKLVLKIELSDPQSGFRVFSAKALSLIKIEQELMAHCSEILYKIKKSNLPTKEVPVTVIYHNFGQKFSGGIRVLKDLLLAKLIN